MAFNLDSIRKTGSPKPPRVVIYGTEGVGKTTFGASAPSPIFLPTEDGLDALKVDAFPLLKTWAEIEDAIGVLAREDHSFETLILDSMDWAENIILTQVARDHGLDAYDSNAKSLAYGRGARAGADYVRRMLDGFDYLRDTKGMSIIILAHSQVKRFDDPTTDAYDRYQLDLNKELASVLSEWCDVLGFATFRVSVKEETVGVGGKKKRGLGSGERLLYTQEMPAWRAKSRWVIPSTMPFDYGVFSNALADAMAATA